MTAFAALSLTNRAMAAEAKPANAEIADRLSEAYAKVDGFIATYHSEEKGKSADITLALDEGSGLAVLQLVGIKNGEKKTIRQWSTLEGRVYMDDGISLICMDSYTLGNKFLREFKELATVPDPQGGIFSSVVPCVILDKTSVAFSLQMGSRNKPSWEEPIKDATVMEANDEIVTFTSDAYGDLSICRKTGFLVRQSMAGEDGGMRVLELKDIRINPGQGEVARLSADWKTDGAKTVDNDAVARGRLMFFQSMVDAVEEERIELAKLEEYMERMHGELEEFADGCIAEGKGTLAATDWKKAINDDYLRKLWLNGIPAADNGDEKAFDEFLSKSENRRNLRVLLVESLTRGEANLEIFWSNLTIEIFGKGRLGDPRLKTRSKDGEAAKKMIERTLGTAYLGAVLDRKMTQYWNQRKKAAP